ncbi:11241_t:CDS:10 [Paraglomus brasilianum]|uniref:11241_t:CDS:1 n=1 Tax=Paraglomus brasilianum TaxID=144538 RepID=A0A9N9C3Q4_9GLOM|nr:11241_t:CDS:10 [Paraglomus brasilianum]
MSSLPSTSNHSSPSSSNSHSAYINGNAYVDEIINISQRDNKLSHDTLQWIPYDELEDVKELAKNDYSSVSVAKWIKKKKQGVFKKMSGGKAPNEVVVSVKTLFNSKFVSKEFVEEFKRHFINDTSATKTSTFHVYGFTRTPSSDLAIIATYYPSNLYAYLSSHTLTPLHKLRLLHTLATRLSTLHNSKLTHRAVHGGNVLVDEGKNEENEACSAELVDFGISWTDGGVFGVPEYVDPSIVVGGSNAWDQADIFAFGIIMWEVAYERFFSDGVGKVLPKPFIIESHNNAGPSSTAPNPTNSFHRSIYPHLLTLMDDTIPPLYASLIRRCWHPLSSRRPSAGELTKTLNVFVKSLESRDSYPEIRSQFDENWNHGQVKNEAFANGWNGSTRKTFISIEKWDGWSEIVKKWEEDEATVKKSVIGGVDSKSRNSEEITASCTSKGDETDDADTINGQELMSDDNLSRVEHGMEGVHGLFIWGMVVAVTLREKQSNNTCVFIGDSDEEHNKVTGHVILSLDVQSSKLTSKDDHSAADNIDAGSSTSNSQSLAVSTNDDKTSSASSDADVKSIQQAIELSKGDDGNFAVGDWVDVNEELKNMQIEGVTDDQMKEAYKGKTKHRRTPNASKSEGSHSSFSSPAASISRLLSHSVSSIDSKRNVNEVTTTGKAIKTRSVKIKDADGISHDSAENESGDSPNTKQVKRRKSRVLNAFKSMKQKIFTRFGSTSGIWYNGLRLPILLNWPRLPAPDRKAKEGNGSVGGAGGQIERLSTSKMSKTLQSSPINKYIIDNDDADR